MAKKNFWHGVEVQGSNLVIDHGRIVARYHSFFAQMDAPTILSAILLTPSGR